MQLFVTLQARRKMCRISRTCLSNSSAPRSMPPSSKSTRDASHTSLITLAYTSGCTERSAIGSNARKFHVLDADNYHASDLAVACGYCVSPTTELLDISQRSFEGFEAERQRRSDRPQCSDNWSCGGGTEGDGWPEQGGSWAQ